MSNLLPAQLTQGELALHLEAMLEGVNSGDTLEGNIEFTINDTPDTWDVRGVYRIGNILGQGGVRMIGTFPEDKPDKFVGEFDAVYLAIQNTADDGNRLAALEVMKRHEANLKTIRGALERGNLSQARIWAGLGIQGKEVQPE